MQAEEIQMVVFRLGSEEFGVDISQVREIIKVPAITRIPNSPSFIEGVINLRGQITTVMDLRKRLGINTSKTNENRIIIVEVGKNTIGMIVDSVTEVLRLLSEDIEDASHLASGVEAEYIRGVGKLKDRLLILLDLNKVLSQQELMQVKQVR